MLDAWLEGRAFIGGEHPSYADIATGVSMFRWMTMPNERLPMPHLQAWYGRLRARPAFVEAVSVTFSIARPFMMVAEIRGSISGQ